MSTTTNSVASSAFTAPTHHRSTSAEFHTWSDLGLNYESSPAAQALHSLSTHSTATERQTIYAQIAQRTPFLLPIPSLPCSSGANSQQPVPLLTHTSYHLPPSTLTWALGLPTLHNEFLTYARAHLTALFRIDSSNAQQEPWRFALDPTLAATLRACQVELDLPSVALAAAYQHHGRGRGIAAVVALRRGLVRFLRALPALREVTVVWRERGWEGRRWFVDGRVRSRMCCWEVLAKLKYLLGLERIGIRADWEEVERVWVWSVSRGRWVSVLRTV